MLSAMEMIQMAGLYNDGTSMQQGIAKLEKSITKLKTDKIKSLLPKESQYAYEFAKKRAKMIDMYVKDLADNASKHMVYDALESYSQILRQCTSCHERVRTTR
jgi:cytochrome c556